MIQYVMPLPHRQLEGECNTLQPWFNHQEAVEDLRVFGCVYDLSGLNDYHKYKTVSHYNNSLIERILYTEIPLFDQKNWWKSATSVYPVWSKTYHLPFCPKAEIHRYLNGSKYMSSTGSIDPGISQTLFTGMCRTLKQCQLDGMLDEQQLYYLDRMVPGDDSINLSQYQTFNDWANYIHDGYATNEDLADAMTDVDILPKYPTSSDHMDFVDPIAAKDVVSMMAPWQQMLPPQPIVGPFKIDHNTSFTSLPDLTSDSLRKLLWELESSAFTDVQFTMTSNNGFVVNPKHAYCVYMGFKSVNYDRPEFVAEYENLVRAFQVYSTARFNYWPTPKSVQLTKTWNEEVFIKFTFGNNLPDENYLYDLAALSIGSPSFTDING